MTDNLLYDMQYEVTYAANLLQDHVCMLVCFLLLCLQTCSGNKGRTLLFLFVFTSSFLFRSKMLKHFSLLEQECQSFVCAIGLQVVWQQLVSTVLWTLKWGAQSQLS